MRGFPSFGQAACQDERGRLSSSLQAALVLARYELVAQRLEMDALEPRREARVDELLGRAG